MITWLPADDDSIPFPDTNSALTDPDGLLAAGGSLRPKRLLNAYRLGIFPWYGAEEPILWWSPSMRAVIFPEKVHISTSLRKVIRKKTFEVTHNKAFREVMLGCAAPRKNSNETWITPEMLEAYTLLHKLGYAHSVECWQNNKLMGGIYGVRLGRVFFGESMFSIVPNASKVALIEAAHQPGIELIDCQQPNSHLTTMGMETLPRHEFNHLLTQLCELSHIAC